MPLPGLIVNGPGGGQHGMNGAGDSHHANIFRIGSNLYAVLIDPPNLPGVFKSTDNGETWAEQNAAGAPSGLLAEPDWFKGFLSGTTIRILCNEDNFPTQAARALQFASDVWGSATATGGVEPESNTNNTQAEGISQPNLYGGTTTQPDIYTAVQRSDGDIVHIYNVKYRNLVTPETWQKIGFKSYSGSWGAQAKNTDTSEHQEIIDAVLGSSDRIHTFFHTSDNDLKHVTIKSDDTFDSTIATLTSSLNKNATQGNSVGHPASNGTTIAIPYQESSGTVKVAIATSADAPTFTSYTVETDSAQYPPTTFINGCRMACAVLTDGRVVIGYLGGSSARKLFYRVWSGGTVGSATEVTPLVSSGSPTVDGLNLNMLTYSDLTVGFMYDRMDNLNSVWYQRATIASAALKYGYFGSIGMVGVK